MHLISASIAVAFAAVTLFALVRCHETYMYPRVEHGNGPSFRIFDNNSFIDRAVIGEHNDSALRCVADNNASSGINWFDEEGNVVGLLGDNNSTNVSFYTIGSISENHSEISLKYRKGNSSRVGLFRCDVPDHHGTIKSLYIYIGTNTIGEGTLRSLEISYDIHPRCEMLKCLQTPGFVLTCRSEGGPATTVEWRRDGELVQEDSDHTTSQIILDPSRNAVYHNTLTVWGREGGEYSCRISNEINIYFKDLTYLSHNTSSMTVKVAKEPLNLNPIWNTDTSLLINWDMPSVIPIGYVIFYKLAHDDNWQSVMVNGSKESYVLEGLRMDNMYNISMLSLSEHLPSALVGSPILSVADLMPSVFVSSSTSEPLAGTEYTLTCSVTLLHGVTGPLTIEWSRVNHGMIISGVNISGFVSQLTLQPLVLDHGGVYVCTANFSLNGVISRHGTDQEELSVIIPEPLISVGIAANRQAYVGNDVTMECIIRLDPAIQPTEVSVDVRWLKNGERYNEQSVTSHDMMSSTIFFDYLLESHGGEYTCEATLTHVNSSPRITSKDFNLPAIVPSLIVITSPSLLRVLDMPPYNQFVLSCTVWAEVEGERVPLEISMNWIKRVSSGTEVKFLEVPAEDYMLTGSDDNEVYQSLLESSETSAEGSTSYRCRASIVRDIGGALKRKTSDAHIAVVGSVSPVLPTFVKTIDSSNDSVTIQWKVSTIAYTPEMYFIEYGLAVDKLNMQSSKQETGPNIMVQDRVYSIELTDLQTWTTYYYHIVATNCDVHTVPNCGRHTASSVRKVKTVELLRIETSGVAQVGQPHGLSCIVTEGSGDLTWTDSSGWVHNSSNGSQSGLELVFPSLELSNVGLYTCRVTLANGDFREVTKEILAVVPPPNVSLEMVNSGPDELIYAGLNLTLQCDVVLDEPSVTYVTVSVEWLKNGENFITCSDPYEQSGTVSCFLVFTPLSHKTDNGSYSCQAVITPTAISPFLRPHNITSDPIELQVDMPAVTLIMASAVTHLLDVSPFVGSCTASVTVSHSQVRLKGTWQWMRRGVGECQFNNITHTSMVSIIHNESMSTLYHDEIIEGNVTYRCIYSLEGIDNISNNKEVTVSVIGIRAPIIPEGVNVTQISTNSTIIQWTVPSIAYTPEMYVVEYSEMLDSVIYSANSTSREDNITAVDTTHSVELKGLKPGTKYYFVVEAQNSNLSSRTAPFFFYTNETAPGKVSFEYALRVNDTSLYISWGLAEPTNGNIFHYIVWVNSSTDNHQRLVPVPTSRQMIITGLNKTMYKVYVAVVNGAGQGEWQETDVSTEGVCEEETDAIISTEGVGEEGTDVVVSTEGISSSRGDGGGTGVTGVVVGVVVSIILLLVLLVILVVVITVRLRKKSLGHKLIITGGLRSSSLLNDIMRDSTPELIHMKPHPPQKHGITAVMIEGLGEGGKTEEGLGDEKIEGNEGMKEVEGDKKVEEAKSDGSEADECEEEEEKSESADKAEEDGVNTVTDLKKDVNKEKSSLMTTNSNNDKHIV